LRVQNKPRGARGHGEAGAALLIAIFALMLISVVAIALVVSTGSDSALAGNFRSSEGAYYASVAGLEEARGRLLWKNPDFINNSGAYTNVLFDPSGALPAWGLSNVVYIINPGPSETVNPTGGNPAQYADTEYNTEFPGVGLNNAVVYPINSVSPAAPLSGPSYKWVRINPVTQQALNIDVNGTGTGTYDGVDLLYYDPAHVNPANPSQPTPSLVVGSPTPGAPTPTSVQVLEITALAVLPNGSTRLLQYVVTPLIISPDTYDPGSPLTYNPYFPAALTMDAGLNGTATFTPLQGFEITGVDGATAPSLPNPPVASIAYTNSNNQANIAGQVSTDPADYWGAQSYPSSVVPPPPSSGQPGYKQSLWYFQPPSTVPPSPFSPTPPPFNGLPLRETWLAPSSLESIMQDIVNSADVVLKNADGTPGSFVGQDIWNAAPNMYAPGWPTGHCVNYMNIAVIGDLTLNGTGWWNPTGCGLLLVTGDLSYHPSASWNGIVLVVGKGNFSYGGLHPGGSGIQGAVFVAQTRDNSYNVLNSIGSYSSGTTVNLSSGSVTGNEITYNSGYVKAAQGPLTYKVLSFHEILTN
jgi:hypothetical protein